MNCIKKTVLAIIIMATTTISAQKNIRDIGEFEILKAYDGIEIELIQSDHNSAEITGDHTDKVTIVNKNGKLKIRMKLDRVFSGYSTFVKLYYNSTITTIDANENAKVFSKDKIKQTGLLLKVQEAADISLNVDLTQLEIKAVSGGVITTQGNSKNQDVFASTGGYYNAEDLLSNRTNVSVNTGGFTTINAAEHVKAKVRAGGRINIHGNPKSIDKQIFLGGRIVEH